MATFRSCTWAVISSASLIAQPFVATSAHAERVGELATPEQTTFVASSSLLCPMATVMIVPAHVLPATAIAAQRESIAHILIALGEADDAAHQMANELTAEDLAVLLANPKMMQRAGDLGVIIAAVVIVGVVVALLILADSSSASVSV